jgi:hypothetical protein
MVAMSKHFAARLQEEGGGMESMMERGFYRALGRPPRADERRALADYAEKNGLANACRLLFNLNEFVFVD